jgi:hypothetical protein
MTTLVQTVLRRHRNMLQLRHLHEPVWQECANYTFPERGYGLNGSTVPTPTENQTNKNRIMDDTAPDSARTLSSNIVAGTTPANSIWFGLDSSTSAEQENDEASRWLSDAAHTIFINIHQSNFDAVAYECMIDLMPSGWFVMYIDEKKEGGYNFEQWPIAQCCVSSSKPGSLIDTIFRQVDLTVEQVINEYGRDNVSQKVRDCYDNEQYDEKITVLHAIYPRTVHAVGARMSKNLPFASMHIEVSTQHLLKESGYHEFPCVVPRWMLVPGTSYATGPVSQALGSIRTINDVKTMELMAMDLAISGMWIAEDDGVLNPRSVKVGPRKIIVANSVDSMKPLTSGADFNVAFTSEERLQASIRKTLMADQLQPQDGPAMTATEVHVRVQLIRQLLGPIYGRLQAEYLTPLITRCFGIAYRAGALGQAPESLRDYNVKYENSLARAQKLEEVTAIDQYVAGAMATAEIYPDVMDTVNIDAAQKVRAKALGVPNSVVPSDDEIRAKRDERQQKQEQAQQDAVEAEVITKAAPAMAQQMVA